MANKTLDRNLEIFFEIKLFKEINFDSSSNLVSTVLDFKDSNYKLSESEIIRASLMPSHLVLDNNQIYVKWGETAYKDDKVDRHRQNILKLTYMKSNSQFKL